MSRLTPLAALASVALIAAGASQERPAIAVVTVPGVDAYDRALHGMRESIPDLVVVDGRDEGRLQQVFREQPPAVAVALGMESAVALEHAAPPATRLLRAFVFEDDISSGARPARAWVTLGIELPPSLLLAQLKKVFPGRTRLGVIRGPMQTAAWSSALDEAARQNGFELHVLDCHNARDLIDVFVRFKSRVDMVWCPFNGRLYNSATLRPLLIASFSNRLPVIGFSEQFVEAGALFGGGPDFFEVGRQAAGLALRLVRREPVAARNETRRFRFSYNERAARLVGVKAALSGAAAREVSVIR